MSIEANLQPAVLPVQPGADASMVLRVRNTGTTVDELAIRVLGDLAAHVRVGSPAVRLFPGDDVAVPLTFVVPKTPDVVAGVHPFAVHVTSTIDPTRVAIPEASIDVAPFQAVAVALSPHTSRGSHRAKHRVAVTNTGNAPTMVRLHALEADEVLGVVIANETMRLGAGQSAQTDVTVRSLVKAPRGGERRAFQIVATPADGQPITTDAAMNVQPGMPAWLPKALVAGGAAIALIAVLLATRGPKTLSNARDRTAPTTAPTPVASGTTTVTTSAQVATTAPDGNGPPIAVDTTLAPGGGPGAVTPAPPVGRPGVNGNNQVGNAATTLPPTTLPPTTTTLPVGTDFPTGLYGSHPSAVTAGGAAGGTIMVFGLGSANGRMYVTRDFGASYIDLGLAPGNIGFVGAPAAASWGPGRLDVLALGADQRLYHASSVDNGATWTPYPSFVSGLFGVKIPGGFSNWEQLDPSGRTWAQAPTLTSWGPSRLDFWLVDAAGTPFHSSWDPSGWKFTWDNLGGKVIGAIAETSSGVGSLDIYVIDTGNGVQYLDYTASAAPTWSSYRVVASSPPFTNPGDRVSAYSFGSSKQVVMAVGAGGALSMSVGTGSGTSTAGYVWSAWKSVGITCPSAPGLTSNTAGKLEVFCTKSSGVVTHYTIAV